MDIHLFLADQIRFEMMYRLEWLDSFPCDQHTLFDMVHYFDQVKTACKNKHPELATNHHDFETYSKLMRGDKNTFIRKMFPKALNSFKQRL